MPIAAGPLRGTKWLPSSGGKLARVLLGTYEPEQTALFLEHVRPGATVFDIGAHVGYYTLLAARLAGREGRVWSFEPHPRNCAFLRRHVSLNRLENVHIENVAIGAREGAARFDEGTGSGTGRVAEGGALEVRMRRLDDLCAEHGLVPDVVKLDVEGAEMDVLDGGARTFAARPVLFLSTHGADVHARCIERLESLGYSAHPILGDDVRRTSEVLGLPRGA